MASKKLAGGAGERPMASELALDTHTHLPLERLETRARCIFDVHPLRGGSHRPRKEKAAS